MLQQIIESSIRNRVLVLIFSMLLVALGARAIKETPLDALPDLSDVQVIIKTTYAGQSPRVIEDQVTYPITTTMLAVPGAKAVRGYSFFGDSYVYVIFEDGTDLYWARSRVLEYLNQAASLLPDGVQPRLGPDATGVGWIYQYALVDTKGNHDLSQLRSLQDWFIKFELQTVPGVSEVATIGGMVKQYQVVVDPDRLRAFSIPLSKVVNAIKRANQEAGGAVIEMAEAEYMIRTRGYLTKLEDIEIIPVGVTDKGIPILLRDVGWVKLGPEMRRGIADLDGEGEVTGGIVIMRFGENALTTIELVKDKLKSLSLGLPDGVEIVTTYDRSELILRAVDNLQTKLIQEFIVVTLVCLLFLLHFRSSFVVIISLPLGILMAFIIMRWQGVNANIMSLGGIAIAIGAMVDAAIVMIENAHKHLEKYKEKHGTEPKGEAHWKVIQDASSEVGPALFFSLLIITLSFIPVFSLEAQEGRLFAPLAFTKTFAMAASAALAITLVPVLMGYFIRGKIPSETKNPINKFLIFIYKPALTWVLQAPVKVMFISLFILLSTLLPFAGISSFLSPIGWFGNTAEEQQVLNDKKKIWQQEWKELFPESPRLKKLSTGIGFEFMPTLEEGDLMYMPTTLPGLSIGKAQQILQQTNALIKTVPEVKRVFGKIGRAETATDPAPLTMIETTIQFKPKSEWREGYELEDVIADLDKRVKFPGLTNSWVQPIKTRIDMLATGIKTPVGIKIAGADLAVIEEIGKDIEAIVLQLPGTTSAYSERVTGGRYIDIVPDRVVAARYGLNMEDINEVVRAAVGGTNVTHTVEGLERYPVNVRYPREIRDNLERLKNLLIVTPTGAHIALSQVASITIVDDAPMLKTENARLNGWIFVDIKGVDLGSYVKNAKEAVEKQLTLPAGYSVTWSGQYEYLLRAEKKLKSVIPFTLVIIFILLYMIFRNIGEAVLVMATLPFALVGGFWLLWFLDFNMSVAVAVGFIALAGVAAEFGVIMLVYLNNALKEREINTADDLKDAIMHGAVMRVRPKAMTVAVIIAGLIPIMIGTGTGSEVMKRIAAPMVGGMITAPLLSLFVIPAVYYVWKKRSLKLK